MADRKNGGMLSPNPRNEADFSGDYADVELYGDWEKDVLKMHLSQDGASLLGTPNVDEGRGIMGGPAAGEPNPAGFPTTSQSNGGKS